MRLARSTRAPGVLALLILANAAGCGLFSPRDPRPGGGPGVNCITPNSPANVVANVVGHYAEFAGVSCYTDMLDTAFIFHPDIADSQEAGGTVFVNWTQDIETRDASAVARNATFHAVSFDSEYATRVISGDLRTETRFYAYHLIIHSQQTPLDTLFQGLADITFFQGPDAQWHITSWVDKRDGSGARTWGYLRAQFRIGF